MKTLHVVVIISGILSNALAANSIPTAVSTKPESEYFVSFNGGYSLGMINSRGVSASIGQTFGRSSICFKTGISTGSIVMERYGSDDSIESLYLGKYSVVRFMAGLDFTWYYKIYSFKNKFSLEPGAAAGYWVIGDYCGANKETYLRYEFAGFRLKTQYRVGKIGFFLEPGVLLGWLVLTPQINSGISLYY